MGEKMNLINKNDIKHKIPKPFYFLSILIFITFFIFCARSYIPNEVSIFKNDKNILNLPAPVFSVSNEEASVLASTNFDQKSFENFSEENSKVTVKFLGIPIKSTDVKVLNSKKLIPSGKSIGINIKTKGVLVLGTGSVTDKDGNVIKPWEDKLKAKDIILEANGININSKEALMDIIDTSDNIEFLIVRNDKKETVTVQTVKSVVDERNKIGVWVRDGTEGIGTLTYINPTSMKFGALGHGVLDVDTNQLMPVSSGSLMDSKITTINKGEKGSPGELIGQISNKVQGEILKNTTHGIYGNWTDTSSLGIEVEIGLKNEVKLGPAYILCDIGSSGVQKYDIQIEDINLNSTDEKGMVIRITDENLLSKTNGIIQGMSGSPIIQNDKIIGAVTHVFVQDPTKGYAIFIENMLSQENQLQ